MRKVLFMSNFEKLKKQTRLVFAEENSEKTKEQIIQKEQNALNDFIINLDKEVYEDLNKFPLEIPMKLDYPDSIESDDFILISVKDEFYLFPKMFKNEISDYLNLNMYLTKNDNITHSKIFKLDIDKRKKLIGLIIVIVFGFAFLAPHLIDKQLYSRLLIPFYICSALFSALIAHLLVMNGRITQYSKKEKDLNELLSKLKTMNFPLEFFDKNLNDIKNYPY